MAEKAIGFGETLRSRRAAAGMTQLQLAERAGVSVRAVRSWESGKVTTPHPAQLRQLRQALDGPVRPAGVTRIRLLGPPAVEPAQAGTPPLPPRPVRLLAVLGLRPNTPVHRDEIIDALWGDRPPRSSPRLLSDDLRLLRRALGPSPSLTVTGWGGYVLEAGPEELDVLRFQTLAARADTARTAGDAARAYELAAAALRCWRGRLLTGIDEQWVHHPASAALTVRRTTVALGFADAGALLGRHADVVVQLSGLAAEDALHEGLHARLMIALAGIGQRAAALRVFETIRRRLDRELGLRPGGELADTHRRLLG